MFTGNRVSLTSLRDVAALEIRRDALIAYAGKVPTKLDARVVPVSRQLHLDAGLAETGISAFVTTADLAPQVPESYGLVVDTNPMAAVSRIQAALTNLPDMQWQGFETRIDPSAQVSPGAWVAPQDVIIGPGVVVERNAQIHPRTIIGAFSYIGPGVILGMNAFDQAHHTKKRTLSPQSGGVRIGENVTIQANTTISRATYGGFTEIRDETLVDAQVYIAHDCDIGPAVTICSSVSISGRVCIKTGAYIGPKSAISNGLVLGENSIVSIGATVTRDVAADTRVTGNFALPHGKWLSFLRQFR